MIASRISGVAGLYHGCCSNLPGSKSVAQSGTYGIADVAPVGSGGTEISNEFSMRRLSLSAGNLVSGGSSIGSCDTGARISPATRSIKTVACCLNPRC